MLQRAGPLLRVHDDGAGHTRRGEGQAEEVAEELAFILTSIRVPASTLHNDSSSGQ